MIAAATDAWPEAARRSAVTSDLVPLTRLGYAAEELDLREYAADPGGVANRLADCDGVWVRGGNTFVLRAQLARSAADVVLTDLLGEGRLAYAGYSAGACVAGPTLRGLESADDPSEVRAACAMTPRWDGLGWIDVAIVPHAPRSSGTRQELTVNLEDADSVRATARSLTKAAVPYLTLTDDQVVIVEDGTRRVVGGIDSP